MNIRFRPLSQRKAAIIAGVALLLMAIIAPIANFKLIYGLISINNPSKTVSTIIASKDLFRLGIFLLMLVALLDIIVAWGLYVLFKPVNRSLSFVTLWFRIVYAAILVFALMSLINVLHMLNGAGYFIIQNPDQINAQVIILINNFGSVWNFGLILFSLHLFFLGYLVYRSGFYPQFLGILIEIAAFGYMFDSLAKIFISNYSLFCRGSAVDILAFV
jgi:hypothetical protein